MATLACHVFMLVTEDVFSVTVMIEGDFFPCSVCMAGLAFFAIVSFVHIVFFVACVADERGRPVLPVGMASFAIDFFVLAE